MICSHNGIKVLFSGEPSKIKVDRRIKSLPLLLELLLFQYAHGS